MCISNKNSTTVYKNKQTLPHKDVQQ